MAVDKTPSIATLENVELIFRNLAGKEGKYNKAGDRNFCVLLDNDVADQMAEDGWNIKTLKPREAGDEPQRYIRVKVNYRGRPPRVVLVTSKGRTPLDESLVEMVDWSDIASADVILSAYHYDFNGNKGISAYLKTMYVTLNEDYLDQKYSDIPLTHEEQLAIEAIEANIIDAEIVEDDRMLER